VVQKLRQLAPGPSLFVLGQKSDIENVKVFPALLKKFKVLLPMIQKMWEEIIGWLFLGFIDENSIFFAFRKKSCSILFT
jgi:hypothetical protein